LSLYKFASLQSLIHGHSISVEIHSISVEIHQLGLS